MKDVLIYIPIRIIIAFLMMTLNLVHTRSQDRTITFFVVSDTHYGASSTIAGANRQTIDFMKKLPGVNYPRHFPGLVVENPKGLVHCGDILDDAYENPGSWNTYRADYGVNGEGRLNIPLYESFGNHDGGINNPVRKGIKHRNKLRPGIIDISENGLHYSWKWGNILLINLNLYPANDWDSTCEWCHYFKEDFKFPLYSLDFLKTTLENNINDPGMPVVILQHYGWDDFSKLWWTETEKQSYYNIIKDYNIIGIFQGHSHGVEKYEWKGINIWSAGSGQRDPDHGSFLVVRIDNTKMIVAERNGKQWGKTYLEYLGGK